MFDLDISVVVKPETFRPLKYAQVVIGNDSD